MKGDVALSIESVKVKTLPSYNNILSVNLYWHQSQDNLYKTIKKPTLRLLLCTGSFKGWVIGGPGKVRDVHSSNYSFVESHFQ